MAFTYPPNMPPTDRTLPNELYTPRTFYTLSGSAIAVWLLCKVIDQSLEGQLRPVHLRNIALLFSELIAMLMVLRVRSKNFDKWIIGFVNGLLIFVNASGANAISTGFSFERERQRPIEASLVADFFRSETNWWPSRELTTTIDSLGSRNADLTERIAALESIKRQDTIPTVEEMGLPVEGHLLRDSLHARIGLLEVQLEAANKRSVSCEAQRAKCADALANATVSNTSDPSDCCTRLKAMSARYSELFKTSHSERDEVDKLNFQLREMALALKRCSDDHRP
ncbi:MAG: hypothetical protein IPN62_06765 [Flavobacteriales bacterium]|nr:hypothetical protein [Flavobacteriales bacterium]